MSQNSGFAFIPVMIVLTIVGTITSAGVVAANSAHPGDLLYPIDQLVEKVQLAVTLNTERKAELEMDFLEERVDEIEQLSELVKDDERFNDQLSETIIEVNQQVLGVQQETTTDPTPTIQPATSTNSTEVRVNNDLVEIENRLNNVAQTHNLDIPDLRKLEVEVLNGDSRVEFESEDGEKKVLEFENNDDTNSSVKIQLNQEINSTSEIHNQIDVKSSTSSNSDSTVNIDIDNRASDN